MKASLDQTKATWASMGADKAALGQACKAASDAFAAQATAMKGAAAMSACSAARRGPVSVAMAAKAPGGSRTAL